MTLAELASTWRDRAAVLARYGAKGSATAVSACAEELEAQLTVWLDEKLTLRQAARESGYTRSHLGRMLRDGQLENVGRSHAPRIRRRDLPKKPSKVAAEAKMRKILRVG